LSIGGGAIEERALRKENDVAVLGGAPGGVKTGDTTANH
jgi:hypothetical protein